MIRAAAVLALAMGVAYGAPGEVVRVAHRDPLAVPSVGPARALVTVELFFVPGPSSRASWYHALEDLQQRHPSKIRLVYRVLTGGGQTRVPYLALEAAAEGRYPELMDKLHEAMTVKISLTDAQLGEVAKAAGMDADRALAAMKDPPPAYKRVVEGNERRRKQHVHSAAAPTLLFNGRPLAQPIVSVTTNDLEREYRAALDQAEDLLDRGAIPSTLADAFDQERPRPAEITVQTGATDEELADPPPEPQLASPPLDLHGLPSYGPAEAAVTIVVACSPTSLNCDQPLGSARLTHEVYPDQVRVVWAPYFSVDRDEAADLALLGDAALCAEKVGTSLEREGDFDSTASPGWRWVTAVLAETKNRRHRGYTAEQIIQRVAERLHVDDHEFSACRAQVAGTTLAWVEDARHSGVRTSPATILGGRVYGPIVDWTTLQLLVEAELTPGWLGEAAPSWIRVLP